MQGWRWTFDDIDAWIKVYFAMNIEEIGSSVLHFWDFIYFL